MFLPTDSFHLTKYLKDEMFQKKAQILYFPFMVVYHPELSDKINSETDNENKHYWQQEASNSGKHLELNKEKLTSANSET